MGENGPPPLGPRLQRLRKDLTLTLDDLARSSGVSRSMLSLRFVDCNISAVIFEALVRMRCRCAQFGNDIGRGLAIDDRHVCALQHQAASELPAKTTSAPADNNGARCCIFPRQSQNSLHKPRATLR